MAPRPLLKETDSYRVVLGNTDALREKYGTTTKFLQHRDGSDVIVELPMIPSDPKIVSALKRAGILKKDVRLSQLTLKDTMSGTYRIYVYSKVEGLLLTLVEAN